MSSSAAQEEYDKLFSEKSATDRHPEDRARASSPESSPSDKEHHVSRAQDDDADSSDPDATGKTGSMRSRYFVPSLKFDANTGPKGVIADAQAFERAKKEASRLSSVTRRISKRFSIAHTQSTTLHPYSDDDYRDKSSEDDEEGFLSRWRQKRLVELQNKAESKQIRNASPSQRQYGSLTPVDAEGYLDAIERVQSTTVVVVYIYDDASEVSNVVEQCVRTLARTYITVRFVKLHYEEAEMEIAGVPALLAYKGGEKFAGLVPITEEIPDDAELSAETLDTLLKKHQIVT